MNFIHYLKMLSKLPLLTIMMSRESHDLCEIRIISILFTEETGNSHKEMSIGTVKIVQDLMDKI